MGLFSRKILNNGYPFLPKWPLKMGRGFEARAAHPHPNQIWVPPVGPWWPLPDIWPSYALHSSQWVWPNLVVIGHREFLSKLTLVNTDWPLHDLCPMPAKYQALVKDSLVHLDVLSLRPQTNITSTSPCAARFGPSALKVRYFWMD